MRGQLLQDAPNGETITVPLAGEDDAAGWREAARALLAANTPPESVLWQTPAEADLFAAPSPLPPAAKGTAPKVSRAAADLVRSAIDHSDKERFALLYRFLYRSQRERGLAQNLADPDTSRVHALAKSVRRDLHKMHAFVRFRELIDDQGKERFIAWFEPDHHIVETTAGFFIRRFANMDWMIVTPRKSIHWDTEQLTVLPGGSKDAVPAEDDFEEAWKAYYASIFNPARVKISAMTAEMPKKYWKNLPEAALIPELISQAQARVRTMQDDATKANVPKATGRAPTALPPTSKTALDEALHQCTACPLYQDATQAVPGAGPTTARLMLIGEQPGDLEDQEGRPFIGPAGQLLRTMLDEAGIDIEETYVTNAVKHFKFQMRGKRRLHKTPSANEIDICAQTHLDAERRLITPALTVTLGASALRGVLGRPQPLNAVRGEVLPLTGGGQLLPTFHPSYLLRLQDPQARRLEEGKLRADLAKACALLEQGSLR